jgi:hypothetical protein
VHWVKGYKDANGRIRDAQEGDYPYAKYNKKVGRLEGEYSSDFGVWVGAA